MPYQITVWYGAHIQRRRIVQSRWLRSLVVWWFTINLDTGDHIEVDEI